MKTLILVLSIFTTFNIWAGDIFDAIKSNDLPLFKSKITKERNLNLRDSSGSSMLMVAAGRGNFEITNILIESGADIHQVDIEMGVTALHRAAQSGNVQIISLLLDRGAFIDGQSFVNGHTPILDSAFYKRYEAIELFLKRGSNLELKNTLGLTVMDWGVRQKDDSIIRLVNEQIARDKQQVKNQKLLKAVVDNNLELVVKLIDNGSDVDQSAKDGNTPLLHSSKYGYTAIVKVLLEGGADANKVGRLMKATPGHKAAFFGHVEILKSLIDHRLNMDAIGPYNGYTALHDSILNSHIESARVLIKAGASVDIVGLDGISSRDLAIRLGLDELIQIMD